MKIFSCRAWEQTRGAQSGSEAREPAPDAGLRGAVPIYDFCLRFSGS
ncbi:MAG: hypothetical protein LBF51_11415 [Zoogloeaceae bacterium]|nr:hypothetical protein [Zoogloeaceae bacterium]